MGMLYDKGLFKFEDKITKYWPEFGQNGKEELRICDVLRHESGLSYFTEPLSSIEGKSGTPQSLYYIFLIILHVCYDDDSMNGNHKNKFYFFPNIFSV